jgi:hypothetical protein
MDRLQRARATVYAKLASVPTLESLKEWERLKLEEDVEREIVPFIAEPGEDIRVLYRELFFSLHGVAHRPEHTRRAARGLSVEEARQRMATLLLPSLYLWAHGWLPALLEGKPVHALITLEGTWTLEKNTFKERRKKNGAEGQVCWDLYEMFQEKVFPFRRCLMCQAVFVRVRRQRYCSPACTYKGVEAARKDGRREYMRTYMADHRRRAKKRQKRKED